MSEKMTGPQRSTMWLGFYDQNPRLMAQFSMPTYAYAVPLDDIFSDNTEAHQTWQLYYRSVFMLTCNDTFDHRLVNRNKQAAINAWQTLPRLPQVVARYTLGGPGRIPVHRSGVRHGARRRNNTHGRPRAGYEDVLMARPGSA